MTNLFRHLPLALLSIILICGGCAGRTSDVDQTPSSKVGMHIDALLEFAVEYPLDWTKTRQQNRVDGWGVIRWASKEDPDVSLSIRSAVLQPPILPEQHLEQLLGGLPGFEMTVREQVVIQGAPALHVAGYTPQATYDIHLLTSKLRLLTITFSTPPGQFEKYRQVLQEALNSFVVLGSDDEVPAAN